MFEVLAVVYGLAGHPGPEGMKDTVIFDTIEVCNEWRLDQEPKIKKFWSDKQVPFEKLVTKCVEKRDDWTNQSIINEVEK